MLDFSTKILNFQDPSGFLGYYFVNEAYYAFFVLSMIKNFKKSIFIKHIHNNTFNSFDLSRNILLKISMVYMNNYICDELEVITLFSFRIKHVRLSATMQRAVADFNGG